jgi:(p)ppGpp synthase/HD superfamily hydrolase
VRSSPTAPGKSESADHDRLAMLANFPQQGHNPSVTKLTSRFDGAVAFASRVHGEQMRKGSKTPYISHLLAVASLVIEYGGSEDAAIAGLLHDCIEDCESYSDVLTRFCLLETRRKSGNLERGNT